MFDKDGKLDERSQRILSEQTIPPRYGRSPSDGLIFESRVATAQECLERWGPPMTATEVVEAEKAYFAKKAAERAGQPDPLEPLIDRMLEICKEHGITIDADQTPERPA